MHPVVTWFSLSLMAECLLRPKVTVSLLALFMECRPEPDGIGLHFGHRNAAQATALNGPVGNSATLAPRAAQPIPASTVNKPNSLMGRPVAPTAPAGIPPKPASSATSIAPGNNGKGVPAKPVQAPLAPRATATPTGQTANATASIPPKPPAQPSRQPRGPAPASQTSGPNGLKQESKPAQGANRSTSVANAVPKAPTPVANGQKGDRSTGKSVDRKDEHSAERGRPERRADGSADKRNDGQTSPTGPMQARPHEKRSLYLKKLPIPTSEEEIKSLFPSLKDKAS